VVEIRLSAFAAVHRESFLLPIIVESVISEVLFQWTDFQFCLLGFPESFPALVFTCAVLTLADIVVDNQFYHFF
jgi:hypothetical protein